LHWWPFSVAAKAILISCNTLTQRITPYSIAFAS
jgi:hypothetical protein